jgi:predicted nucleotide-binding protein (sugar kinase/HSP70/actin superfamily)
MVYQRGLDAIVKCMENDAKGLAETLENIGKSFQEIPLSNGQRKPVISVMGEVFMRDNPYCSAYMVDRLEKFGAETLISGFSQFLVYFTIRYLRDSKWKGDYRGILKSKIQEFTQTMSANRITKAVYEMYDNKLDVSVNEMLDSSAPYIHRHYDGDPAVNLGTSVALAKRGVSGLANIIPFTCMPGSIVEAVSHKFKEDYNHIPTVHIAFDGQEDTSIELRLQAFMHQAYQYRDRHGYTEFSDSMKSHLEQQKNVVHT